MSTGRWSEVSSGDPRIRGPQGPRSVDDDVPNDVLKAMVREAVEWKLKA